MKNEVGKETYRCRRGRSCDPYEDIIGCELVWLGGRVLLCDALLRALEDGNGRHSVILDRYCSNDDGKC